MATIPDLCALRFAVRNIFMSREIRILHQGYGAICAPLDVDALADGCAGWASDLREFRPFHSCRVPLGALGESDVLCADADVANSIWIAGRCESGMDLAWEFVRAGAMRPWDAVIAVEQTSGRGQLRRPWLSVPGNLHVCFHLACPPSPWDGLLSLLVGYAICSALSELGADLRLKWPNDLYQSGRKVGGILVEQRGDDVIVGMGLNLLRAPQDCEMRKDAAARAGVLEFQGPEFGPVRAWRALVNQSKNAYMYHLENNSPTDFLSLVSRRLLWLGHMVFHQDGGEWRRARLIGLHHDGGLVLEREGSRNVVYSGSILFERP
jgi:BirA family biotin operon repressor/biotin-[acetyl-CoA-carboxylase] ligase